MRKIGLLAFGVTTSLLVPAALHVLNAGPKQVAKLMAPDAKSLSIGESKIDVSVDKSITDAGDTVKVKLALTGDKAVTVAIVEMESEGSGGGRVENPPAKIARKNVTIPAGGTKELAFRVRGSRGLEMDGVNPFGRYTFLVMEPKAADTFEKLRRKAFGEDIMVGEAPNYTAFMDVWNRFGDEDVGSDAPDAKSILGAPGSTARLDVLTRPNNSPVSIKAPESMQVGQTFPVVVTLKNPTRHKIDKITIHLAVKPDMLSSAYLGLDEDMVTIAAPELTVDLAAHQSSKVEFQVTAKAAGTLGLYATSSCDDCYGHNRGVADSALDAVDITAEKPAVVGSR